jgi:hypothetical protein
MVLGPGYSRPSIHTHRRIVSQLPRGPVDQPGLTKLTAEFIPLTWSLPGKLFINVEVVHAMIDHGVVNPDGSWHMCSDPSSPSVCL